jgi:hypothetical protein
MLPFKLKEPKKETQKPIVMVADLDRLESHSVGFTLHGKVHIIKPVKVKEFYATIERLASFVSFQQREKLTDAELNAGYLEIMRPLCDTITLKDIEDCSPPQISGLFQIIVDTISGKTHAKAQPLKSEEKKSPVNP